VSGKWGAKGICDLPIPTFEAFLQFVKQKINPDMVIWLGDNENHDFRQLNKTVNLETTDFIANAMREALPDTPIYPSIGNHESFPIDLDNPFDKSY
jgi:Calcineurin-like phosphoesterase